MKLLICIAVCCLIIQIANVTPQRSIFFNDKLENKIKILCFQGFMYFSYPLLGHIADAYLNRYRVIILAYMFHIFSGFLAFVSIITKLTIIFLYQSIALHWIPEVFLWLSGPLNIVGTGFFKANAIQFGLDQLLEAPTSKLIAFIHWYYWSLNIGAIMLFTMKMIGLLLLIHYCITAHYTHYYLIILIAVFVILIFTVITIILFCRMKKYFYILEAGFNPFKNIYKVLKYSWKHKVPERRSAFTYWEEDIPHRIDLGKNKYGGPFTNEEVEDTKTFLRILPLLLCLFGYHLAEDGYSAPIQLQRTSCPSLPVLLLIVYNPQHLPALVTMAGIPLYRLVIKKMFPCLQRALMLTRMWFGLLLSLLQILLYIIIVINHDTTYWQKRSPHEYNPSHYCYKVRVGSIVNDTCAGDDLDHPVDNTYLWFIIPQLLNGLSSLLVSMTVFEFICAQAPRTTQGLLIGLWYATFSIRYLVVGILDNFIIERRSWLIYEGVKGFLILVSLVLFSCVSRHYRYRQRDEIVNVQGMIEEIYERRMDQEEEYMQERRALLVN